MSEKNIQINRISADSITVASRNLLARDYMVCRVACTDLKYHEYSSILDLHEEDRSLIRAVYHDGFSDDKRTYYLLSAGREGKTRLESEIEKTLSEKKGALERVTINQIDLCSREELPDYILLNLLLFTLSVDDSLEHPVCNMTGGLYQVYRLNKRKYKDEVITALKYRIYKDLTLFPEVQTFSTKESFKGSSKEISENEEEYIYDEATGTMHRAPHFKGKYVRKRSDNERTEVAYFMNPEKESVLQPNGNVIERYYYRNGKLAYLTRLVLLFNKTFERKYGVRLHFDYCPQTSEIRTSGRGLTEIYKSNDRFFREAVKGRLFSVISTDPEEQCIAEGTVQFLQEELGIQAEINGSGIAIVMIHKKGRDSVSDSYYMKDYEHQHVTYENCRMKKGDELDTLLLNTINNAVIKDDLHNGKLTLYDAKTFAFPCIYVAATFPWREPKKGFESQDREISKDYIIGVDRAGTIVVGSSDEFLKLCQPGVAAFGESEINMDGLCRHLHDEEKPEYAVQIGKNVNLIYHSHIRTMPDMDYLQHLVQEQLPYSRTEKLKSDELAGLNDLRSFKLDGNYYYFVGEKSANMNCKVAHAPNARLVKPLNSQNKILIPELLPLMCVPFNRYERLSVVPFPYKYLHEYALMDAHKNGYRLCTEV